MMVRARSTGMEVNKDLTSKETMNFVTGDRMLLDLWSKICAVFDREEVSRRRGQN